MMRRREVLPFTHQLQVFALFIGIVLILGSANLPAYGQVPMVQSDWSGGPGESGPVVDWTNRFDTSDQVAWRPIPGQLALPATPRTEAVQNIVSPTAFHPNGVAAGDIDGDGDTEILTTRPVIDPLGDPRGAIYWWERPESGQWIQHTATEDLYGVSYVDIADVDDDDDPDIIAAAYYGVADPPYEGRNGRFAWLENVNGDGTVWTQHLVGEMYWGARYIQATDIDGDGDTDLLGASELTDGIGAQDADVVWFENLDGNGTQWSAHSLDDDFPRAFEAHAADLDGDDDLDIVASQYERFAWWENLTGDGSSWTKRSIAPEFFGAGYLDIGDIDQDGDLDIIGSGYNTGVLAWWRNLDGDGTNWDAFVVESFSQGYFVILADLDGDADLDAAATRRQGAETGGAWWFENSSSDGFFWDAHQLKASLSSRPCPAIGDADGDGKLDVVISCQDAYNVNTEQVSYFDITEFADSGELTSSILDGADTPDWGRIWWDETLPEGTALTAQVRASDDPENLGGFSTVPANGSDLSKILDPEARFLQYRLVLNSSDPNASPIIREIEVEHGQSAGVDDGPFANRLVLHGGRPNPFVRHIALSYALPNASSVSIQVLDALGRQVNRLVDGVQEAGFHTVTWSGENHNGIQVGSGVYFVRLEAVGEARVERIIHVR